MTDDKGVRICPYKEDGCIAEPPCPEKECALRPLKGVFVNEMEFPTGQSTIKSRENSHGSYYHQARTAQDLKKALRDHSEGWKALSVEQRESLDMMMVKVSRILNGNPNEPDHWLDISGYATLIHNTLTKGTHL